MHSLILLALLAANPPVTEISIEQQPWKTEGPRDRLVLRSDGTASYVGRAKVDRIGSYEGTIDPADFAELSRIVERRKFFELKQVSRTWHVSQRTTRVKRGDEAHQVVEYGDDTRPELREIDRAVRDLAAKVDWKKVE